MSIMCNQICINEEMLPKFTYIDTNILVSTYICITVHKHEHLEMEELIEL